jgi:hypothetical protein
MADFDPDEFLKEDSALAFDPDEFLAEDKDLPVKQEEAFPGLNKRKHSQDLVDGSHAEQ